MRMHLYIYIWLLYIPLCWWLDTCICKKITFGALLHKSPQEDAEAAGWCARLCEDLQGAEAFAASDGLDAFISVAMGQSVKSGSSGGLMVALAEALTMEMSEFKVAIFETLCAAAQWPSLKGRIAGCGVLGVITAKLLSPRPHPPSRALMARLCGMLATDSPEVGTPWNSIMRKRSPFLLMAAR